jgi:hypothetical protein
LGAEGGRRGKEAGIFLKPGEVRSSRATPQLPKNSGRNVRETIFLRGNATFVPSHTAALKRGDFGRKSRLLAKYPQISYEQLKGALGAEPLVEFF